MLCDYIWKADLAREFLDAASDRTRVAMSDWRYCHQRFQRFVVDQRRIKATLKTRPVPRTLYANRINSTLCEISTVAGLSNGRF